jgi:hypothetical protein
MLSAKAYFKGIAVTGQEVLEAERVLGMMLRGVRGGRGGWCGGHVDGIVWYKGDESMADKGIVFRLWWGGGAFSGPWLKVDDF